MSSTLKSNHQLPSAILSDWDTLLHKTPTLSESGRALLRAAIRYALPPPSRADARQALHYYLSDLHVPAMNKVNSLVEQLPIQTEKCRKVATSHPLYTAMVQITDPNQIDQPLAQASRRMMSQYFADVASDAHSDTLYQDIVKSRDVLLTLTQQNVPDPGQEEQDDHYLMGQINRYIINTDNVPKNLRGKSATFQRLFRGMNGITCDDTSPRLPGMHSGRRAPQRRGRRNAQRDEGLDDDIRSSLHKRDKRRQQQQAHEPAMDYQDRQQKARSEEEFGGLVDRGPYRYTTNAGTVTDGEDADEHVETLKRTKPTTMTVDDDRRVVQHAQRMSLIDTLSSMTDIHRLTASQLIEILLGCRHDPAQWSLSLLLLCTGMPLERLMSLEMNMDLSMDDRPEGDTPQVIENGTMLTYRLLDGPSKSNMAADDHRWVTLSLPAALTHGLEQAVTQHGDSPLRGAAKKLKGTLTRMARDTSGSPGLPATPRRLSATSWMLVRPMAHDDVAAKALSGHFGIALAARAAYRALAPGELNDLFQQALGCLLPSLTYSSVPGWLEGGPYDWFATPYTYADKWQTGSCRAVPVAAFGAWFDWLRRGMREASRRFMTANNPRERSPQALLDAVYTSAAHAYLAMLLTTGCRPHGRHVRCERVGDRLWLADKNSPKARESRWIPLANELLTCLDEHRNLVADATDWLTRRGYEVKDRRSTGEFSLCAEINWTHQAHMAVIPINHDSFIKWMTTLQPDQHAEGLIPNELVRNITRHSVATHCRGKLPDTQLAALLGHVSGFRQQGPGSSAIGPSRGPWQTVISDLLKEARYQALTRSSLHHALRH